MLQVLQVTRRFGRRMALAEVSFNASPGEVIGLLGPNGAGKTTLLRLLACFLQPTRGTITFNGLDGFRNSLAVRRLTGYMPERCPLYDDMTVGEYLRYRGRIKGLSFLRARRRSRDLMERLGLDDVRGRLIGGLSLGSRRRVGLADALIQDPKLLLLDDPLANVDACEVERVLESVAGSARHGTVIISGHALDALAGRCTRFIVLRSGQLTADVTRHEIAKRRTLTLEFEVAGTSEAALRRFSERTGVGAGAAVSALEDGWWRVSWPHRCEQDAGDRVAAECLRQGWRLRSIRQVAPGLGACLAQLIEPSSAERTAS